MFQNNQYFQKSWFGKKYFLQRTVEIAKAGYYGSKKFYEEKISPAIKQMIIDEDKLILKVILELFNKKQL
jgi:hypothetical protein